MGLSGSLHGYQMGLCLGRNLEIGPEDLLAFSGRFFMMSRQMTWTVQEMASCYCQVTTLLGWASAWNISIPASH